MHLNDFEVKPHHVL